MARFSSKQRRGATTLLDQAAHESALAAAFADVRRSGGQAGVDGIDLGAFEAELADRVADLSLELKGGWYAPLPVQRVAIPKPDGRTRVIGVPVVRDRVVARACQKVLAMRLDRRFLDGSFAYRPGRSCRGAIDRIVRYIRGGRRFVASMDIADFFPSVDRSLLETFLHELFPGDPIVPLLLAIAAPPAVEHGIAVTPPRGIEQGSAVSPLLANVFLHPWDSALESLGACWVRYSDNAVVACTTRAEAEKVLSDARADLGRLGLSLNPVKSAVHDASQGFPFLGHHITSRGVGPELKAVERLRSRLEGAGREDAGEDLEQRLARRRKILFGWASFYRSLDAVVPPDPWSFVAALEVAVRKEDHQGVRHLLEQPLPPGCHPATIPLELLARAEAALDGLGMPKRGGRPRRRRGGERSEQPTHARERASGSSGEAPGIAVHPREDVPARRDLADRCDDLLSRGAYREAVRMIEASNGARGRMSRESLTEPRACPAPAVSRDAPLFRVSARGLERLMALFRGAPGIHARMWVDRLGRRGYAPERRPMDEAAWREHLEGTCTRAIYLFDQGRLHTAVLDVDIAEPGFGMIKHHQDALVQALAATHDHAVKLVRALRKRGLDPVLEASGQKGRHVWVFFEPAAAPRDALALLRAVADEVGPPAAGVHCETLPPSSRCPPGTGGPLVTSPLGVHRQSGGRSVFLEENGDVVSDVGSFLARIRPARGDGLRALVEGGVPPGEEVIPVENPDLRIAAVLEGCPVMRRLVDKAGEIHHLGHMERMAILYVMGHFGDQGIAFVHRVMARCANYDKQRTQGYCDRLKPSPVSCRRLKEWLPELVAEACRDCRFPVRKGAYPTPVLHGKNSGP